MEELNEQQIAALLRELPAPPQHLVERAKMIPRVNRQMEQVLPKFETLEKGRRVETAELEKAIEAAGLEHDKVLIDALKERLEQETDDQDGGTP
ncbi:MAG TPA: hypothetical protein PKA56_04990 [Solirubrobacterales bacterium]|nr:hypothetical protein [Solirubrobacterales bacterium]HMW44912.1 hypothetical protein [Solirubrobacterales bacterium]HMX71090.1 hypothetical protein [Solirubrobacterales bacterium]HMY25252.1 hypothetical protein [Solirubrobacterales bacterium]HNA23995.1 hypothetical protein [Solirubrobacterales bacterium]